MSLLFVSGGSLSPIVKQIGRYQPAVAAQENAVAARRKYEARSKKRGAGKKLTVKFPSDPSLAAQHAAQLRKAVPIASTNAKPAYDERAESLIDCCTDRDLPSLKALLAMRVNVNYVDEVSFGVVSLQ